MYHNDKAGIPSSIMSFENRGPWGKSSYRGNCSGHVQKGLIEQFRPRWFVDVAEGSGTSRDVCRDLGVKYTGLDLHSGFNLLRDKLRRVLQGSPDFAFFHPPYGEMIPYSGNMWGQPHADDLSRCGNGVEFLSKMELALLNIHDAIARGGHYAVLIGDMRAKGEYHSWQADIINMGIGKLKNVLIKAQHKCVSDRRQYSGDFVPINHEYLLVFMKENRLISIGELLVENNAKVARRRAGTWKEIITRVMQDLGGEATIDQTVEAVLERIDAPENKHVGAKVRQVLQGPMFNKVAPGRYTLQQQPLPLSA